MKAIQFESDTFPTSAGDLTLTFIGHGSLMLDFKGKVIHIDPYTRIADYSLLPKADLIFLTHEHSDHLDPRALEHIQTGVTTLVMTEACARQLKGGIVMKNGETRVVDGIPVETVPAYNRVHLRENGQPYHPKGEGNGYILTFGKTRLYIAGDTENIPEMMDLKDIDIAFLPMNLPYTMTSQMAAEAALGFKPRALYPYHFSSTKTADLERLLAGSGIDVRIRKMA
ncbi:MAG: MBL fold metallo-hydrolase [Chloroflexi bacterium]|nr:MBL fold metallo-hydrolase [Chloroflexota bacterium]